MTIVPGNHDEYLRRFCDLQLGNIMVTREAIHRTADGRLLLVVHGDEFDGITRYHRWVAVSGDVGYEMLLVLNRWFNRVRRVIGLPYWSLSAYVKGKVKRAVNFVTAFEAGLAHEATRRGLQGVVCGHIHRAEMREHRGRPLLQHRRLGRELHGPRRDRGWHARAPGDARPPPA